MLLLILIIEEVTGCGSTNMAEVVILEFCSILVHACANCTDVFVVNKIVAILFYIVLPLPGITKLKP